ncbi:2-hydroxyacid dehydrogenase [Ramlibacter sp.]|uniref:2-hydroxyacid dehydrogenase n=1 Tax=Ramlibacter sp. TaxID=1917967 RepID=UPI003D0F03C7
MTAPTGGKVFVCRDHVLVAVLDALSRDLQSAGVEVVRGPPSIPGITTVIPPADYARIFGDVEVALFTSRTSVPRSLLESAPRLRGIVNLGVGLETMDLEAADELGIVVGYGATPENTLGMAEATVMLMLNLRYRLRATEAVLRGERPRPAASAEAQHGRMLRGCTVGVVGLGRIGRAVVDRLRPFGVEFIAYAPTARADSVPADVALVDFDALMQRSDIVGLFAAAHPGNRRLVDARALSLMKPDAYLVNIARGQLVDEAALYEVLRDRRIAGAALDVFETEPLPKDSPLRTLDNAILTPHLVGHTRELYEAMGRTAFENVTRLLRGEAPLYARPSARPAR